MIQGTLLLQGVQYGVIDRQTTKQEPVKILAFKDVTSGVEVHIVFLPNEFDTFIQKIQGSALTIAREMPKLITQ